MFLIVNCVNLGQFLQVNSRENKDFEVKQTLNETLLSQLSGYVSYLRTGGFCPHIGDIDSCVCLLGLLTGVKGSIRMLQCLFPLLSIARQGEPLYFSQYWAMAQRDTVTQRSEPQLLALQPRALLPSWLCDHGQVPETLCLFAFKGRVMWVASPSDYRQI